MTKRLQDDPILPSGSANKPRLEPGAKLPPKEPDAFPDPDAQAAAITAAGGQMAGLSGELPGAPTGRIEGAEESTNEGYGVPASPLARADKVLAQANQRMRDRVSAGGESLQDEAVRVSVDRSTNRAEVTRAERQYSGEAHSGDMLEDGSGVLDLMTPNLAGLRSNEVQEPGWFREFLAGETIERNGQFVTEGQMRYEEFMHEPVVIRIHSTRDKNEPKLVYVGVNGDSRWLARNVNVRIPRKLVERLAQAQEMAVTTEENPDPRADVAMDILKSTAQSYEFSVLRDTELGHRWLRRMFRSGC